MHFIDKLATPGEHQLFLQGLAGQIETVLSIPQDANSNYIALLGHPHSLQGGTMNNKVVTTMARVFNELGISSLRFNFRGVGQSEGTYDNGIGESEDMLALAKEWQKVCPEAAFIFAGFSFGSYVAYRTAAQCAGSMLITIAPPVHHYDYREFDSSPHPWLIVHGDEDEVVPVQLVLEFAQQSSPVIPVIQFANTTHFFHGKLLKLKTQLIDFIRPRIHSS